MTTPTSPLVFLSHITEEKQIADVVRLLIEEAFPHVTVFQSSDEGQSLPTGQNRFNRITDALRSCSALLILCSAESIGRPWINFEAGAGWSRDITVTPICHSTMTKRDLPFPLSLQTAHDADDADDIRRMLNGLAGVLGSRPPKVDLSSYIAGVQEFAERYKFEPVISKIFAYLHANTTLTETAETGKGLLVSDMKSQAVYSYLERLKELDVLTAVETRNIQINSKKFIKIDLLAGSSHPVVQQLMLGFTPEVARMMLSN